MVTFSQITEKQRVNERYPYSTTKIGLVQQCAAIWTAELLSYVYVVQNEGEGEENVLGKRRWGNFSPDLSNELEKIHMIQMTTFWICV